MTTSTAQRDAVSPAGVVADSRPVNHDYKALLRSLGFGADGPGVIGLTSCCAGAGVSTIASNLAIEAAHSGLERVLLIDASLMRPRIHHFFAARSAPGFVQALMGDPPVEECIQRSPVEFLHLLTAGVTGRGDPPRICLPQVRQVLDVVRNDFDFVVVDLPSAGHSTVSFDIAPLLGGLVLVVESNRHRIENLQQMKRMYVRANANLLGVVLNKCRP